MQRIFNVIWVALMLTGAVVTYVMKDRAGRAADHVAQLRTDITREKDAMTVLKAEWSVLDQPSRLQALVGRYNNYLGLEPIDVRQFVTAADIPVKPPLPIDGVLTGSVTKPDSHSPQTHTPAVRPGIKP
jgi:hypothetical protein